MNNAKVTVDAYAKYARQSSWFMLAVLIIIAIISVGLALGQDAGAGLHAGAIQAMMPIAIIFIVVWAQGRRRKLGIRADSEADSALAADEFRQLSIFKACRVALLALLVLQIPVGVAVETWLPRAGATFMGYLMILCGCIAYLAALLYFERDGA